MRYLGMIVLANCGKFCPSRMNSRPIHKETLNAVWLLEHPISYQTQFSNGALETTISSLFCHLLHVSSLFAHRDGSQVCQACSYCSLDLHSSKERGWDWEGLPVLWHVELAEPTSTIPVRDRSHWVGARLHSAAGASGIWVPPVHDTAHVHKNTGLTLSQVSYVCVFH